MSLRVRVGEGVHSIGPVALERYRVGTTHAEANLNVSTRLALRGRLRRLLSLFSRKREPSARCIYLRGFQSPLRSVEEDHRHRGSRPVFSSCRCLRRRSSRPAIFGSGPLVADRAELSSVRETIVRLSASRSVPRKFPRALYGRGGECENGGRGTRFARLELSR